MSGARPRVSAIVVAFGAEEWLQAAVERCLASEGADVEVVVVDNGCTDGGVDRVAGATSAVIVRPGANLGFAGGCNAGVAASNGDVVALINPDALVDAQALAALAEVASRPGVGIATASVRLADRPELLNSAGNEVHPSGISWSGSFGQPAASRDRERDVFAASGAACALRRQVWDDLGGFEDRFFAYYEDAELSMRCWQRGLRVVFTPGAVVRHRYEFTRRPEKFFLLERNRLMMVLTCYSARTLVVLAPMLAVVEAGVTAMAVAQGWGRQKAAGWRWLVSHRREVAGRRRQVQADRARSERDFADLFSVDLLPGNLPPPAWFGPVNAGLRAYWRVARRWL
ncbi:MAG: glycosyltransferase family 2 protein [Acidimicrobiia bacterium]